MRAVTPNAITAAALCLGLTGIRLAIDGNWQLSILAVLTAGALDGIDGRIARLLKAQSRFGAELDGDEMVEGDVDHFRKVLDHAVNYQAKIDQMTDRALVAKWPIARIDPTLRALFRAAGAELVQSDTPPKVVIVEYVDVAKAFFPEGKESRFVNAVLDHMAREAKPEAF